MPAAVPWVLALLIAALGGAWGWAEWRRIRAEKRLREIIEAGPRRLEHQWTDLENSVNAEVARRSEELKSAVLDAMAHEIRNPLNSIKLAATTLLSGRAGSELYQHELLTIIDEEASRMDRSIDQAVELARMEAKDLPVRKEPHDIQQLIAEAIEELGALPAGRRIERRIAERLPQAECDRDLMLRVLKELLSNALKYSAGDNSLLVTAELVEGAIVVSVIDHGPGVAENERERIFEKYYRGGAARGQAHGNGLGLASAKCMVEAHGGRIWVTGAPGGGSAFHVELPAAAARHLAEAI